MHKITSLAVVIWAVVGVTYTQAEDRYWSAGTGWWNDDGNWLPVGAPDMDDRVFLHQSDGIGRIVTYVNATAELEPYYESISIDATGDGTMTFVQSQDYLYTNTEHIGQAGTGLLQLQPGADVHDVYELYIGSQTGAAGTFSQSGSLANNQYIYLGYEPGASGAIHLTGGELQGSELYIGWEGTGTVTHSGGRMRAMLSLGSGADAVGTYELSGTGEIESYDTIVGAAGEGSYAQDGESTAVLLDLVVGDEVGSEGFVTLHSGTMIHGGYGYESSIGHSGVGTFVQNGGLLTSSENYEASDLFLGYTTTGEGTFEFNGGEIRLGKENQRVGLYIGADGTGHFFHNGGDAEILGGVSIASWNQPDSEGTYEMNNGSLHVASPPGASDGDMYIGSTGIGTFEHNSGAVTIDGDLFLGHNDGGDGTYRLDDGTMSIGGTLDIGHQTGCGHFFYNGGTLEPITRLELGGSMYSDLGRGVFDLMPGRSLTVGVEILGKTGEGVFNQHGGTHVVETDLFMAKESGAAIGTLNMLGGTIDVGAVPAADHMYVGHLGSAVVNHEDGTITVAGDVHLGAFTQGSGTYNLAGGTLTCRQLLVRSQGASGTFHQTGGVLNTGLIQFGTMYDGTSTFLFEDGEINLSGSFWAGEDGTVLVRQEGGSLNVDIGVMFAGSGQVDATYELAGGDVTCFAWGGYGTIVQSGGSVTASSSGFRDYTLSGGTLEAGQAAVFEQGDGSPGKFVQTGGSHHATIFEVGNSSASAYELHDGTFTIDDDLYMGQSSTGTFLQAGGTLTIGDGLSIGGNGDAVYTLAGGSLAARGVWVPGGLGTGALHLSNPDAQFTAELFELGYDATLTAAPGMIMHVGAQGFRNRNDSPEHVAGLGNLDMCIAGPDTSPGTPIEVAGKNLGTTKAGLKDNFAIGTLHLSGRIGLIDNYDNSAGEEAVYVDHLIIEAGAHIDFANFPFYYREGTIDPSATFSRGELIQIVAGDQNGDGQVDLDDHTVFTDCMEGAGQGMTDDCVAADVDDDGDVDLSDFAQFQSAFTGGT